MGLPGVAYLSGVASAAWTAIGLAIGTYVNWLIVARRIRVYSKAYEALEYTRILLATISQKNPCVFQSL